MKWFIALSLAFCTQMLSAQESPTNTLIELITDQGLIVVNDPEIMLLGAADGIISEGIWSEENVIAFNLHFGYKPTALPLTRITDKNTTFNNAKPESIYYLYMNIAEQGELSEFLRSALGELTNVTFQSQLEEKGFTKLPKEYLQLWRVKLGLAEPRFTNGYL